jgi:Arc/MetJ family transcription regulator
MKVRTTVLLDEALVAQARAVCGATTNSSAIEQGLKELVRKASLRRLAALGGADPKAKAAPRRRPSDAG